MADDVVIGAEDAVVRRDNQDDSGATIKMRA